MTTIFEKLIHFFSGSHSQDTVPEETWQETDEHDFSKQEQRQLEEMERQQMEELIHETNPYENPGMDSVVDEGYFGMDEGLGIANSEENLPDDSWMNDSGTDDSWMNDSGADDSWMNDSSSDDSWMNDSSSDDSWMNDDSGFNDFGGF